MAISGFTIGIMGDRPTLSAMQSRLASLKKAVVDRRPTTPLRGLPGPAAQVSQRPDDQIFIRQDFGITHTFPFIAIIHS